MLRVRKFLRANWKDKALFAGALGLVAFVRLGLSFRSYNWLKRWVPATPKGEASFERASGIALAVSRASRLVPHASCLTQAFAGQLFLACQGYSSSIRIGVDNEGEKIIAHAWLLAGEQVVLGGGPRKLARYSVLADLGTSAS
jgi:hypothetical protein